MRAFGLTDAGRVRQENQDSFRIVELGDKQLLSVICDGMGGAQAGAQASRVACDTFVEYVSAHLRGNLQKVLTEGVSRANEAVYRQAQENPEFAGMGTTLTALCVSGKDVCIVNVGDSRVYAVDEAGITCLTTDHSVVEWMVQRGELSSEQAKSYPGKNMITRAVGTEETVECDVFQRRREPEDVYLLCSDGMSNQLGDQEILFEVVHGGSREDCCQRLMQIVLDRGAPDNVTMVLVCD